MDCNVTTTSRTVNSLNNNQEEIIMADLDTMMLANQHSDIRREAVAHTNEIVKEGLKGDFNTQVGIKDARFDINSRLASSTTDIIRDVDRNADRLDTRFFDVARDTQDIRAQIIAQQQQMVAGFMGAAKDSEINALKTQVESEKQTRYLSDKIDNDGEKTRGLINELRDRELNRLLVERNTDLVGERWHARHWRHGYDNAQWASLNSQLNAFQSQLQETRQGMVNFGTMAGVGQTSTSNNVR
jgi:hypothetical protein